MAHMDIFNSDAFSQASLMTAFENLDYQPSFLRGLNLFTPKRVRTETVSIEQKDGVLSLIQTTPRGAALEQNTRQLRNIRDLRTVRIAKGDRINASEIQGIREFGSESELQQVQREVMDRYNGPSGIVRDVELTWENMMLGAVQGIVTDADASTIYDYYSEFGVTQATEIDFDLDNATPASGAVRQKCNQVIRQMKVAAKGAWVEGRTYVMAICGDTFFDQLTMHSEVRETYLNYQKAQELQNLVGAPFGTFIYGGITWVNYRGTDDGSTVAVSATQAKFFPVNANGVFQMAYSPGEFLDVVNTPGKDLYPLIVPDRKRNMYVDVEVYSYPLPICTRPLMLQRARNT